MKTLAELRKARAAALAAALKLRNDAKAAARELTGEELTAMEGHLAEAATLKTQIDVKVREEAAAAELDAESEAEAARLAANPGRKTAHANADDHRIENVRDRAEADPKRGFKSMGDFSAAVAAMSIPGGQQDERLRVSAAASGMSQSVGADGGFLVPPEFANTIWDGMNANPDNLINRCDPYTVQGESLTFPANAETSRATGSRYGGIQGYWIAEADAITGSAPKFRDVKLEPKQLAVLVYATEKLLRNSPVALDQYINRAATDEILFLTGDAIINGSGVGKPKGILAGTAETTSCRVAVAKEAGQAAATIVLANILKMWARLHARARAGAAWFINQDIEPQLSQLALTVGTGGLPVYMPPGGVSGSPYSTLFGRPVVPLEFCPTLGTEGDIILADMKSYAIGLQGGLDAAMSMHLRFNYAEMAFRFMFAVDGQTWLAAPITPFKGTAKQSSIVTLATRA